MKVLSRDIGIINLGYVFAEIIDYSENVNKLLFKLNKKLCYSEQFKETILKNVNIIECGRVDITNMKHSLVPRHLCTLHHDFCIPDYLDHFIQEHQSMFDCSDTIILERQPPTGITNVQDLLFKRFRHKVIMVSPISVHGYFCLSKDYNTRKLESEKISTDFLKKFDNFNNNIRKHDISDSLLMFVYYYNQQCIEYTNFNKKIIDFDFEQFRL